MKNDVISDKTSNSSNKVADDQIPDQLTIFAGSNDEANEENKISLLADCYASCTMGTADMPCNATHRCENM